MEIKQNTNEDDRSRARNRRDDEKQPSVTKDLKTSSAKPSSFFEIIYGEVLSLLSRIFV